ncbi:MAG: hypothetical protein L6R35_001180 [Caloplaca aegaea]|nr:MAG: hypothetical protein L6R35_001180 [Caloplaca aegaea]
MGVRDSIRVLTLLASLTVLTPPIRAATLPNIGRVINLKADWGITVVTTHQTQVPLDGTSCKITALEFMANLALLGDSTTITDAVSPPTPQFPGVAISGGSGSPETKISVQYLLGGIQMAMEEYIANGTYLETDFDILWTGQKVGVLVFRHTDTPQTSRPVVPTSTDQRSAHMFTIEPPNVTVGLTRVLIQFLPNARPFDENHVFLAMYYTIQLFAGVNRDHKMAFTGTLAASFSEGPELWFTLSAIKGRGLPGREPPFMRAETVIEVCRRIPFYMAAPGGAFKEIQWEAVVGDAGDTVGKGVLRLFSPATVETS